MSRYSKLWPAGKASVAAPRRLKSHPQSSSISNTSKPLFASSAADSDVLYTTENGRNAGTSSPACSGHIECRLQLELFVNESLTIGLSKFCFGCGVDLRRIVKYICRLLRLEVADLPRDRSSVRFVNVIASYDLRKLFSQAAGKVWVHQPHMDAVASLATLQYSVELILGRTDLFIHGLSCARLMCPQSVSRTLTKRSATMLHQKSVVVCTSVDTSAWLDHGWC